MVFSFSRINGQTSGPSSIGGSSALFNLLCFMSNGRRRSLSGLTESPPARRVLGWPSGENAPEASEEAAGASNKAVTTTGAGPTALDAMGAVVDSKASSPAPDSVGCCCPANRGPLDAIAVL